MITTDIGAYNEMCLAVRTANAGGTALVGYLPEVRYDKLNYPARPAADKVWVRFKLIQSGEKKRTLSVPSRITQFGIADLSLFVPVTLKNGAELSMQIAALLKNAYRRTASVDFFKVMVKDMPKEENKWFYTRITATYNYDIYS